MSAPGVVESFVKLGGESIRVWEKGAGEALGVFAGLGGLNAWTPFLDELAKRRRVVVPSLPGFPGGGQLHRQLDNLADWVACTLDLLEAAGLDGAELVGHSIGGTLAAEAGAFSRASVKKLTLIAPFGLFDESEPVADVWARRVNEIPALFSAKPAEFAKERLTPPAGLSPEAATEWAIVQNRATEAAARLLWPVGELGLAKRLHRISCPVKLVWGAEDRVVPPSYAKKFASGLAGPTETRIVPGAGHALDFDAPGTAIG
ncbi:MAG TPA: alpha/beta fold hydrolase [Myxococcota bacterium]|nr:alpha/beta fold hydrolase [Myxococcota bacterium]